MADEEMTPERFHELQKAAREEPWVEPNLTSYTGSPSHERAIWHSSQQNLHAIHAREAFLDGDDARQMHHQKLHDHHEAAALQHQLAAGGPNYERHRQTLGRLTQRYQDRWGGGIGVVPTIPPRQPEGYGH